MSKYTEARESLLPQIEGIQERYRKEIECLSEKYGDELRNLYNSAGFGDCVMTKHHHKCVFEMIYEKRYATQRCKSYLKSKGCTEIGGWNVATVPTAADANI